LPALDPDFFFNPPRHDRAFFLNPCTIKKPSSEKMMIIRGSGLLQGRATAIFFLKARHLHRTFFKILSNPTGLFYKFSDRGAIFF